MRKLLFLACIALVAGCGGPSLVGIWEMPTKYGPLSVNMGADNRFRATGQYLTIDITVEGTYSHEGKNLSITPVKLDAVDPSKSLPQDLIDRGKALFGPDILKQRTGTMEWKTKDQIVLTQSDGEVVTLTRKPESPSS